MKEKPDWYQKVYLIPGTSILCLPALNIISFLSSINTDSAPKVILDSRKYKTVAYGCLTFVTIQAIDSPNLDFIPFTRDGKYIEMGKVGPNDERDPVSGLECVYHVARLKDGIPNEKQRPLLPEGWQLEFNLMIGQGSTVSEDMVHELIQKGGILLGLGTYRRVFGKYRVDVWEKYPAKGK
jgi:hypothetical protein